MGLAAGTATLVFGMASIVPERFGTVLAPPPRRAPLPLANPTPLANTEATPTEEAPPPTTATRVTPRKRVARAERRRGFSPVIRPDEPPTPSTPPETEDEAVAQIEQAQRTPEQQRRWEEGQAAAARAATRAARHAGAVAGRAFGPSRRSVAEAVPLEEDPDEGDSTEEAAEEEAAEAPGRPPEDDGRNGNAPPLDVPDEDVE